MRLALGLVAAALLAGCGGGSDDAPPRADRGSGEPEIPIVQPGAPGEPSRTVTAAELADVEPIEHTAADADFMRGMIHHHSQALVMTDLARKRAGDKISLLARRMEISQQAELEVMERWLKERGEETPDADDHAHDHGGDGKLMPGMFSAGELARLAGADGRAFDALFVRYMLRHHNGALTMVRKLRAGDGGMEPEIDAFARHVDADQLIEIRRMESLRAALPKPRRSASGSEFAGAAPRICVLT
jgi:uncharacterized protein (DUF305 family)